MMTVYPVSILYKFIAGRYRLVRIADGPITARYRFIKNASWVVITYLSTLFKPYRNDGMMIMKGSVQCSAVQSRDMDT